MKTPSGMCCSNPGACGCCEGVQSITPEPIANRPGLLSLAYRVGTHATFLDTMRARLSSHCLGSAEDCAAGKGDRPLALLGTREAHDPAIALMDAWAVVADVLTFYQERIANEGYLRTATERRSVLELARLIGYRLRPGVAASVYLAYDIDPNVKEEVVIGRGARAQSVPGPDELPQSFETSEDLKARANWNVLKPRQTEPQRLLETFHPATQLTSFDIAVDRHTGLPTLYFKGLSTNLVPNDVLLVNPLQTVQMDHVYRVINVELQPEANRTKVAVRPWNAAVGAQDALEPVHALLTRATERAPQGAIAKRVMDHVERLRAVAISTSSADAVRTLAEGETLPALEMSRRTAPPGSRVRAWLDELVDETRAAISAIPPAAEAVAAEQAGATVWSQLQTISLPPSRPKANSLRLDRDLKTSFKPTSDSGLQLLATGRPDLDRAVTTALATYRAPGNEPRFEVHVLRQKTGLFGQTFPGRQETLRRPRNDSDPKETQEVLETHPIGEWSIVITPATQDASTKLWRVERANEDPRVIYLDGSFDKILPGSWLVFDFGGMSRRRRDSKEDFPSPLFFVEPTVNVPTVLVARAEDVRAKLSRAEYGASGPTTRITLSTPWMQFRQVAFSRDPSGDQRVIDNDYQIIRGTTVYAQSERLELAEAPIDALVCGGDRPDAMLELDGLYSGLEAGRFLVMSGERGDIEHTAGVMASEPVMISEVVHDVRNSAATAPLSAAAPGANAGALPGDRTHTFIRLDKALSYCYRRENVTIYGNVVKATHGETLEEVMGNGDGAKPLQAFALKQSPITHVAAPTAAGVDSTLDVFVNDTRWHEAESFDERSPADHCFVTKTDDDQRTTVVFGNGREGARLPTGVQNVKAVYRKGIGKAGNVRARQITLLSTRPLGVKDVINPLRASGGADRDTRDQARRNAPVTVQALDRLLSTRDYQDFSRAFAGIGKASAAELSDGRRTVVHVTIAGNDDIPIDEGSDLFRNLRQALQDLGDPFQPVTLAARELLLLVISAKVRILPDYRWEPVITAVRAALLDTFGFARRELGEDVFSSEVLSVVQAVRGVDFVDLDVFGAVPTTEVYLESRQPRRRPRTPEETATAIAEIAARAEQKGVAPQIVASLAIPDGTTIRPAEIAMLTPDVPATLILNRIQ